MNPAARAARGPEFLFPRARHAGSGDELGLQGRRGGEEDGDDDAWDSEMDMDAMAEDLLMGAAFEARGGEAEPPAATTGWPEPRGAAVKRLPPGADPEAPAEGTGPPQEPVSKRQRRLPGAAKPRSGPAGSSASAGPAAAAVAAAVASEGPSASSAAPEQPPCSHPTYWAGMCVVCGAPKPDEDSLPPPAAPHPPAGRPGGTSSSRDPAGPSGSRAHHRLPSGAGGSRSRAGGAPGPGPHPHHAAPERGGGPLPEATTRIKHMHASAHLELSGGEAERLRRLEVARLLAAKKLVLVLDLDHTLVRGDEEPCGVRGHEVPCGMRALHMIRSLSLPPSPSHPSLFLSLSHTHPRAQVNSVRLSEIAPADMAKLKGMLEQQEAEGPGPRLLYCLRDKNLMTKLRPFVYEFLEAAKSLVRVRVHVRACVQQ
jgi:hypothetical protein